MKFYLLPLAVLLLLGCSQPKSTDESKCDTQVISLGILLEEALSDYIQSSGEDSSQVFIRSQIVSSIYTLAGTVIDNTGGINPDGSLFSPCTQSMNQLEFFRTHLAQEIIPLYDQLDLENQRSLWFKERMDNYFLNEDCYFNQEYFETTNISILSADLFISGLWLLRLK